MKLTEMENHDSEHSWIAKNVIQSDWPVTLILRVQYMEAYLSDRELKESGGKYCVEVLAIAPDAVSADSKRQCLDSCGLDATETDTDTLVWALKDYGIYAPLYSEMTNNKAQGIKNARKVMKELIGFTFGFAMDRAVNAIGNTGWDWIKGEIGFKHVS